jgi:nucleotide-binding universal stress UspA family protein
MMGWSRILTPLLGDARDDQRLAAATGFAAPFCASVSGVLLSSAPGGSLTRMFSVAGLTDVALRVADQALSDAERAAGRRVSALKYPNKDFSVSLSDCLGLRIAARLSDVAVFEPAAALGGGFLGAAFHQVLIEERRPALVTETAVDLEAPVAIAWDGGPEASRAVRRATPWLRRADDVVILTAPGAGPSDLGPDQLIEYLADQGVRARPVQLASRGETASLLMDMVRHLGAGLLVAGAFGHTRLQRFIFGGTTRLLLASPSSSALFLSH